MNSSAQFSSPAEHYDRFMGRYTTHLAPRLAEIAAVRAGMKVLDVGCGPGGLTTELAQRAGADNVAAIDPAGQFAEACRERNPGADVREGVAEDLPWADDEFDASLSCLVIRFMRDPVRGVAEMARVTAPGGRVAICMWDIGGGGMSMLRIFWSAMREVKPDVEGETTGAGTREGDIEERLEGAGLNAVEGGAITVSVEYEDFADFWRPLTLGVGPAGQAYAALEPDQQSQVEGACRAKLPEGSFSLDARAWYGCGTV